MSKRVFAWFLTLCMVFTLLPTAVFAADTENDIRYGYFTNGVWAESPINTTYNIDGLKSISKTAAPVAGQDNVYTINLKVVMAETTIADTTNAATALVFDTSGSMDYCAECGFAPESYLFWTKYHADNCSQKDKAQYDTRLDAAKKAALKFVDTFSGCVTDGVFTENDVLHRYVAIVSFDTRATVNLTWVNISSKAGYDQARAAINKLKVGGGTNLDDGLTKTSALMDNDLVKNFTAKNTIALTDGAPTYANSGNGIIGNGNNGSKTINDATAATAKALREKAKVYTVCYGAADETTYKDGPSVGAFLKDSIATENCAYNADKADELISVFEEISEIIVSGINAGIVNDSIPAGILLKSANIETNALGYFTWVLKPENAVITTEGNETIYTYQLSYTVEVDTDSEIAKTGNRIPTNGVTTVTVGNKVEYFPVPAVKAKFGDFTITYHIKNTEGIFEVAKQDTVSFEDSITVYTPTPIKGYDFHGWYSDKAMTIKWIRPDSMPAYNIDLYGEQVCVLNFDDHFAYIIGYEDGTVKPHAKITRAEVATIFFRLLTEESRELNKTSENPFSDVQVGDWYNNAISTLANMKILVGYEDGTFQPNKAINRAEMATIISAFAKLTENPKTFTDIEGHWAQKFIELAAGNGWIAGYEDGTFKPEQAITRAETMSMINRVLKRVPENTDCLLKNMTTYPDCNESDWFYIAVQEATNSHYFQRVAGTTDGSEEWLELRENFDWSQLEK